MEQHPVPQNVTTFQFRLIGDMTIKQFGYLAAGAFLAFISYKLPLPFFFTWPLTILSALTGFGLAFVPIEERPMDVWIAAFIKNVYSPTQYVWQKTKAEATTTRATSAKPSLGLPTGFPKVGGQPTTLPAPLKTSPKPGVSPVVQPAITVPLPQVAHPVGELIGRLFSPRRAAAGEAAAQPAPATEPETSSVTIISRTPAGGGILDWLKSLLSFKPASTFAPASQPTEALPSLQRPPKTTASPATALTPTPPEKAAMPTPAAPAQPAVAPREAELEKNLQKLKAELEQTTTGQERIVELQKQLTEALAQKEKLEKELISLRRVPRTEVRGPQVFRPAGVAKPLAPSSTPTVRVIAPEGAVRAGLPRLTTFPNIVTGIVKDSKGNLLSGVLVTVRDKNDVPLRALKTNRLGQFAASTPLPNGTYLVEVEDPRGNFTFDRAEITVTGAVIPAIEIFAKSQRQIDRDKLAAEIFGSPKPI